MNAQKNTNADIYRNLMTKKTMCGNLISENKKFKPYLIILYGLNFLFFYK